MKRMLALLAALMLVSSAAAEPVSDDALLLIAVQMAQEVDLAAVSPAYVGLEAYPEEICSQLKEWSAGEHDEPIAVWRATIDEDVLASYINMDSLSPTLAANLLMRLTRAVVNSMNASHGSVMLAASSSSWVSTAVQGTVGCCIYFLSYAEGADVAVCFYPIDGGISGVTAMFLAGKYTQEDVQEYLGEAAVVEKVL